MMLTRIYSLAFVLFCFPAIANEIEPDQDQPEQPHAPVEAYQTQELLGWTLRVHQDLIADQELHEQVMGEMHHQLFRITRVLPEAAVEKLRGVTIWIEMENPHSAAAQYHPNRRWLEDDGYLTEKAKCVEISHARRFLRTTKTSQPFVVLHELAHAYHDQELGFDQAEVIAAYESAKERGDYEEVLHINGREVRHYALTNHKEYFAEATEAYFGTNDYFPFVRGELRRHDPDMHALIGKLWGVE